MLSKIKTLRGVKILEPGQQQEINGGLQGQNYHYRVSCRCSDGSWSHIGTTSSSSTVDSWESMCRSNGGSPKTIASLLP